MKLETFGQNKGLSFKSRHLTKYQTHSLRTLTQRMIDTLESFDKLEDQDHEN